MLRISCDKGKQLKASTNVVFTVSLWIGALFLAPVPAASAQPGPLRLASIPILVDRVMDETGTLTEAERSEIRHRLITMEGKSGTQLLILVVPSTAPETIEDYSLRVARKWRPGRPSVGDGLLIVLAMQDRAVRIEVSKSLEPLISNNAAYQIIQSAMLPDFRAGNIAGGLMHGIEMIELALRKPKNSGLQRVN